MLALSEVPRLGLRRLRYLLDLHGSATAALAAVRAGRPTSAGEPGESDGSATEEEGPAVPAHFPERVRRELRRARVSRRGLPTLMRARGIRILTYGGPGYPPELRHLEDPPPILFLRGPGSLRPARRVAVVGTRRATSYGRRCAEEIGAGLARAGVVVVSGMAEGIDAAAHRGALAAGGTSIGVLGSGLDHEFPASNRRLYRRMHERGLLVSEFLPDQGPTRGTFPRRNRIIAALSEAVVVVQAGKPSGALITADHAIDLGREVLAVPGRVDRPKSVGVHSLLQAGAGLVTGPEDVLRALKGEAAEDPDLGAPGVDARPSAPAETLGGAAGPILARLEDGEADADALAAVAGLPPSETLALLTRLELEGRVAVAPGGRYELVRRSVRLRERR